MTAQNTARTPSLAEQAMANERRIERCSLDLNYPTEFERGMLVESLDDSYLRKTAENLIAMVDYLRQQLMWSGRKDGPR